MGYRLAADLILVFHLVFIVFALFGGLLCLHRARWAWLHLPAMTWGIWIEWSGGICPLTPLENRFRHLASEPGYHESFIEHYLVPLIYPEQLNPSIQWILGAVLLLINLIIYWQVLRAAGKRRVQVDECCRER